jgi:hypothetical protein
MVESEAHSLLVWLLREDENDVVKVTATAAAANLLLEFSPVRNVRTFRRTLHGLAHTQH